MTSTISKKNGDREKAPPNKADGERSSGKGPRKNPKGDPCEFIDPPNLILAKVTHNPEMAKVRSVKKGDFVFDSGRLKKMSTIIEKNQTVCVETLDKKIQEIEPVFNLIRQGKTPQRKALLEKIQNINAVAKVLDHIPVARITLSLIKYLSKLPAEKTADNGIVVAHFDALFNRETLSVRLDPPTKMVLTALETLTNHALANSR
ncbi:MAG: hypothetical protein COA62_02615 [Rhodobiaceae bacterium]|nr:MAG: hypothetical protein COA62_02615 [Rhodobiaceae bacterium]